MLSSLACSSALVTLSTLDNIWYLLFRFLMSCLLAPFSWAAWFSNSCNWHTINSLCTLQNLSHGITVVKLFSLLFYSPPALKRCLRCSSADLWPFQSQDGVYGFLSAAESEDARRWYKQKWNYQQNNIVFISGIYDRKLPDVFQYHLQLL